MIRVFQVVLSAVAVSLVAGQCADGAAAEETQGGYRHLKPLLMEPDKMGRPAGKRAGKPAERDARTGLPPIAADAKSQTVRIPVRPTGAEGVVEWLLAGGGKHEGTSVLVTGHDARAVAEAFGRAGLPSGRPPRPVGADAARRPTGPAVRLTLVGERADGEPVRLPAERLLAADPRGKPVGKGRWVYAGPQTLAEGEVLISALSGSIATTNLRDTSAMIYWVPAAPADGPIYVRSLYARAGVVPAEASGWALEVRPVGAKKGAGD